MQPFLAESTSSIGKAIIWRGWSRWRPGGFSRDAGSSTLAKGIRNKWPGNDCFSRYGGQSSSDRQEIGQSWYPSQNESGSPPLMHGGQDVGTPTATHWAMQFGSPLHASQQAIQLGFPLHWLEQSEPPSANAVSGTVRGTSTANAIAKLLNNHVPKE